MYFDFGDGHPDLQRIPRALSTREEILTAIIVHLLVIIGILVVPRVPFMKARALAAEQARVARIAAEQARRREQQPFMFVQPRLDVPARKPPPQQAPPSDMNRQAMTFERPPHPVNRQPFMRGNTSEFSEATPPSRPPGAQVQGPATPPAPPAPPAQTEGQGSGQSNALRLPDPASQSAAYTREHAGGGRPQQTGPLGEALRNLQRYANPSAFDNPQGGNGTFGPSIQFDTKGVEFGPWIRRFIAQIKRNWFVPYAAMSLRGHTVITFNVHKDGSITDLAVVAPSDVEAFNHAASNALALSNPTADLPTEYPSDKAFFTVTFYYNESPPSAPSP